VVQLVGRLRRRRHPEPGQKDPRRAVDQDRCAGHEAVGHHAGRRPRAERRPGGQADTAFDTGNAAFEINYPFVWSSAQATKPKVFKQMGYAPFPSITAGTAPKVSIGGYNLGISTHSQHPRQAFDAVKCLVQPQNQVRDAVKGGLAPVLGSIYQEKAFEKAYPFHQLIKQQLQNFGIRPQTPAYADITLAIQDALSPTSAIDPTTIVSTLRNEVKQALSSKALL
jgi:multiple sugar transport system substrate-binding protein